jgi:glycosyltransferase involved in cell wall biosynthesis
LADQRIAGTIGGITTFMLNVINSSLNERYEFLRFTTSRPPKKDVADNYGYQSMLRGGFVRVIQGFLITIWHLIIFPFVVISRRADVVQIQSSDYQTFWEASLYVLICRALRRPVLWRLGGMFDHFYETSSVNARSWIARAVQLPDRLIVQSDYWKDLISKLGRTEGVIILPNSVPDALPSAITRPKRGAPICLFIAGTEAVRKGIEELVTAMRLLGQRNIQIIFHLLAVPTQLREHILDEHIVCPIEIDGYVEHNNIFDAMRNADIFLLPSRGEGFPNSLLEAMALGLACIATPVGAVPEIVREEGAILIPVRDGAALADAICRLTLDPTLRHQIAERGRLIVCERYITGTVLPILHRTWTDLLTQR